jgi:hypothetical protein
MGNVGQLFDSVVPVERIELPTFGLQNRCSTAELNRRIEVGGRQQNTPLYPSSSAARISDLSVKGQKLKASPGMKKAVSRAFSGEVVAGSHEENASKQNLEPVLIQSGPAPGRLFRLSI